MAASVPACVAHPPPALPGCLAGCRRVQGLDATAARTFVTLHSKLHRKGIQLIITHLPTSRPGICKLLVAQGLILRRPAEAAIAAAAGAGDSGDGAGGTCLLGHHDNVVLVLLPVRLPTLLVSVGGEPWM